MRLRCERDTLVEALATASRATAGRGGSLPVLTGVRLEVSGDELAVAGSDLDLVIETSVAVTGSSDGVAVAPGRLLVDIVRNLEPGAVTLDAGEDEMHISSGRAQFAVRLFPADDFPRLPVREGVTVSLPSASFASALRQVVIAASSDDARPMLTGVLITSESGSGLRMVATDSYRLAKRDLPGPSLGERQKVLVPARALSELARVLPAAGDLNVRLGSSSASFDTNGVLVTTQLIDGEFPNYNQLIPAHYPNRLVVSRESLAEALRRVRPLVRDANSPVRLALRSDGLELSISTPELGTASEDIDATYEGADMTVAFNPAYLGEGIEACGGDEVQIELIDGTKPATIRPTEGDDYLYLLMPVRVSS